MYCKILIRLKNFLGGIQHLRGQNFAIFDPPPAWTVFIPWVWTKTDIFLPPPPPSSCPRSYWMPYQRNTVQQRRLHSDRVVQNIVLFAHTMYVCKNVYIHTSCMYVDHFFGGDQKCWKCLKFCWKIYASKFKLSNL